MAHHLYFLVDAHRAKRRGAEAATDVLWHPNLNLPTHWRASLALLCSSPIDLLLQLPF
jgi:hypothetical protein